jgi:hypothetical protein
VLTELVPSGDSEGASVQDLLPGFWWLVAILGTPWIVATLLQFCFYFHVASFSVSSFLIKMIAAGCWWLRPATWEPGSGRSKLEASLDKQFMRTHLQNNQNKMDWSCGSSSREPAPQARCLEFKLQPTKKKKKKSFH